MKILEIRFSNINNLKGGPHVLSFTETPLSTAGIFAILGPTGSGKSTILDVITLSLFNKIPRFSKAISKGEMSGMGSVITHFANKAFAEISYQIGGKKYISKWSVSKTKKGKLKDYEMSLQEENGNYFDLKRSEVPSKNESIIGLKYDQFIKSIILSQGEFSKFLKADKNERGQLLENITGTGIYRKIGSKVFSRHKEIKAAVANEIENLGEIHVLDEEALNALQKQLEEITKEKTAVEKLLKDLNTAKTIKTELFNIEQELKSLAQSKQQLTLSKNQFAPLLAKLAAHEKVSPLQAELTTYKAAEAHQKEAKTNLELFEKSLASAKKNLSSVIQEMAVLTKQEVDAKNFKTIMSSFEKEVNDMDADLRHRKANGAEQRKRITQKQANYPLEIKENIGANEAIPFLKDHQATLQAALKKSKIKVDDKISDLRNNLKASIQLQSDLENYYHLIQHGAETKLKQEQANKERAKFHQIFSQTKPLIEKCEAQLKSLESIDKLLKKQKEDANKIATLEAHRKQLTDGKPCPLCGSLEHPYSIHLPEDERSALEEKISNNLLAINNEKQLIKDHQAKLVQSETSITLIDKSISALVHEAKHNKEHLLEIQKKQPTIKSKDLSTLQKQLKNLISKNEDLELAIEAHSALQLNIELIKEYEQFDALINEYKSLVAKRKAKFEGPDPTTICNNLQDKFNNYQALIIEDGKVVEMNSKNLANAVKIANQTKENLAPKIASFGFNNILELEKNLLSPELLADIVHQKESLIGKESAISASIKSLNLKQKTAKEKDSVDAPSLEALNTIIPEKSNKLAFLIEEIGKVKNQLDSDTKLRQRRKDKEAIIKSLNDKLEKWGTMNQLIGDAHGNKFANFAQGLTLQNLLVFTNKRLLKLSDRYLLDRPGEDGILRVVDQYQGNTQRAVSTLSGGETFLISLALALSLSDMASKNVSLDSLFIDEGFGTLDQDTLDIALNTLEQLQTESQKTVGVISHVEALKERINVQIRLEKNAQGYSQLKIVG